MSPPILPDRHTVYLTNTAWKKLKERAILEDTSATGIVAYLLETFLDAPRDYLPLSRYQARISEEATEQRKRRTIYVPDATWARITTFCEEKKFSVSGVIEYVLMGYLGLLPSEEEIGKIRETNLPMPRERLDFEMGDDPFVINLTPKKDE